MQDSRSHDTAPAAHLRPVLVTRGRSDLCRSVLASLPAWFGRPAAVDAYVAAAEDAVMLASFAEDGASAGVLTLRRRTAEAVEIKVMGVVPTWHRRGVGRALVEAALSLATEQGARFMTVKTLAPSHPDVNYAGTRRFYETMGFLALETFPTLWGEGTPCLMMIQPLAGDAPRGDDVVEDLERALLTADSRSSIEVVSAALADDFVEFGSSGHIFGKTDTVRALAKERDGPAIEREAAGFRLRPLGEAAALLTYHAVGRRPGHPDQATLRSSIWECREGRWRMVFHQGTLTASPKGAGD